MCALLQRPVTRWSASGQHIFTTKFHWPVLIPSLGLLLCRLCHTLSSCTPQLHHLLSSGATVTDWSVYLAGRSHIQILDRIKMTTPCSVYLSHVLWRSTLIVFGLCDVYMTTICAMRDIINSSRLMCAPTPTLADNVDSLFPLCMMGKQQQPCSVLLVLSVRCV